MRQDHVRNEPSKCSAHAMVGTGSMKLLLFSYISKVFFMILLSPGLLALQIAFFFFFFESPSTFFSNPSKRISFLRENFSSLSASVWPLQNMLSFFLWLVPTLEFLQSSLVSGRCYLRELS